ncbi:MAG: exodeoxyribonuclease VII large subunit [Pyrinomonadaceae bacterium]
MTSSLLQSLFDEQERRPLSVSELNAQVRQELERRFASVWVEGEVVNFVAAKSGHWYFTLHDGRSQLRAACYRGANYRIQFQPFDGLQVRVRGRMTLYEPRGEYQILVESLEPVGEGALRIAYEQIKAKLEAEGLFARELKRKLPVLPRRVGVVTSPNGAAYFDILHVLSRRTRSVHIVLIPTRVQGEGAGEEIRAAIAFANQYNKKAAKGERIDVLIVGRGGGSAEDLWAFNEERLARAIRDSKIPVISAVGHEVDFTIADFVADLRAATPSAAAEIVAAAEAELQDFIDGRTYRLFAALGHQLVTARANLQRLAMSPVFVDFPNRVERMKSDVDDLRCRIDALWNERVAALRSRLDKLTTQLSPLHLASKVAGDRTRLTMLEARAAAGVRNSVAAKDKALEVTMASLDAMSPLSVLKRGFSITQRRTGEIVGSVVGVNPDEQLNVKLHDGDLTVEVKKIEKA